MPAPLAPTVELSMDFLADPYPEQFEQFYSESRGRIYNLAARVVGNPDDAADITQEVFLRAFAHPPDAHGRQHPDPWLYRVAMNVCYDHLRRRSACVTISLEDAGEIAASADGFAESEMTQAVEAALGALNVRYRTALVLKDLHGLDTGEVAEAMGVSKSTARVLLHRSRRAFRRAFRETAPAGASPLPALGLAGLLPTLPLPAALQALTPLAGLVPATPAMLAPLPATGLLVKIGGALSVKGAAVALAAVAVAGGGLAAQETISRDGHLSQGGGGANVSSVVAVSPAGAPHELLAHAQRQIREGAQKRAGAQSTRSAAGKNASRDGAVAQRQTDGVEGSGSGPKRTGAATLGDSGVAGGGQAASGGGAPQSGASATGSGGGGAH